MDGWYSSENFYIYPTDKCVIIIVDNLFVFLELANR